MTEHNVNYISPLLLFDAKRNLILKTKNHSSLMLKQLKEKSIQIINETFASDAHRL